MMSYTKGPWFIFSVRSDSSYIIATGMNKYCDGPERTVGEFRGCASDANLVTIAPELLESLQKAVESLEWAAAVIGDIPQKSEYMERIAEAKAVMAKATGEQP